MAGNIFLNYRRADGGAWTFLLRDKLIAHFGEERVFHDISGVPLGARVRPYLSAQVADCAVMVTVIGPQWLKLLAERAAGPGPDHVLIEIEAALRQGKPIIPVLAGGAAMPAEGELPLSIQDLADCAGTTLGIERLDADVAVLISGLEGVLARVEAERGFADSSVDMAASGRPKLVASGNVFTKPSVVVNQAPLRAAEEEARKRRGKTRVVVGLPGREEERWLAPGESIQDASFAPEMVLVPPGKYFQGDETGPVDGIKRREVTIGYPLLVGKFPVTFDEWDAYVEKSGGSTGFLGIGRTKPHTPSDAGWGRGRRPVIYVSWKDTQAYATWLSETTGKSYRLLSEAEWEYACRAGTETAYSFGDTITKSQAQFSEGDWGSAKQTVEVGRFPASPFGLHDMHGNVWEWCQDAWVHNYQGAPVDVSARSSADTSVSRVLRGGSWNYFPESLRSAVRFWNRPVIRSIGVGFRLARTLHPTP